MKRLILSLLSGAALVGGAIFVNGSSSSASAQHLLDPVERVVPESQLQLQFSYAPVVKETAPAVVNVFTQRKVRERVESSLGSGVIVRNNGIIVTNAHVVKGADELRIVLNDRREFEAEVIAEDEEIDVAVLKIDTKGEVLPSLNISQRDDLEIGDIVCV